MNWQSGRLLGGMPTSAQKWATGRAELRRGTTEAVNAKTCPRMKDWPVAPSLRHTKLQSASHSHHADRASHEPNAATLGSTSDDEEKGLKSVFPYSIFAAVANKPRLMGWRVKG